MWYWALRAFINFWRRITGRWQKTKAGIPRTSWGAKGPKPLGESPGMIPQNFFYLNWCLYSYECMFFLHSTYILRIFFTNQRYFSSYHNSLSQNRCMAVKSQYTVAAFSWKLCVRTGCQCFEVTVTTQKAIISRTDFCNSDILGYRYKQIKGGIQNSSVTSLFWQSCSRKVGKVL